MESSQRGHQHARERLVAWLRRDIRDERLLTAFARVPRERFVPLELADQAYEDRALPIGEGQTISQPTMVAIMLEALELAGDERVLEVGTGSGYQAALLSHLAREVVTVERIPELAATAANRLQMLGYSNVRVVVAGQELGWPEGARYDGIVVAAGAPEPPPSLVAQLAPGGRLVVPAGAMRAQQLVRVTKRAFGVTLERLGACRFVPLIHGDEGWPESSAGQARAG